MYERLVGAGVIAIIDGIVVFGIGFDHRHRLGQRLIERHTALVRSVPIRLQPRQFGGMETGWDLSSVGYRNPVVIRVDFAEGEEAMPVAAILYKCSLQ